jgi:hypothetical protein
MHLALLVLIVALIIGNFDLVGRLLIRKEFKMGLAPLQAAVAALATAQAQVIADVTKLLANQSAGPGPGQVIVNQADVDALTTSVQGLTAADVAADATVNPPPAASSAS